MSDEKPTLEGEATLEGINSYLICYKVFDYHMEFVVLEGFGRDSTGVMLLKKDGECSPTEDRAEAEVFIKGMVKWDGCSNWWPDTECWRFCGKSGATEVGAVFAKCYDLAALHIPKWQG